jgi:hypothetical protein
MLGFSVAGTCGAASSPSNAFLKSDTNPLAFSFILSDASLKVVVSVD